MKNNNIEKEQHICQVIFKSKIICLKTEQKNKNNNNKSPCVCVCPVKYWFVDDSYTHYCCLLHF